MTNQFFVVLLIGLVVLVYVALAVANYVRMRGTRVIVCPENQQPAAVKVDAAHAAMTAVWESPDIRLQTCSRWPEREGCEQACTGQIAVSPAETLAFEMLKRWYSDKNCAICRRAIPPLQHVGPKPGMLNVASPTHETLSWDEIPGRAPARDVRDTPARVLELPDRRGVPPPVPRPGDQSRPPWHQRALVTSGDRRLRSPERGTGARDRLSRTE